MKKLGSIVVPAVIVLVLLVVSGSRVVTASSVTVDSQGNVRQSSVGQVLGKTDNPGIAQGKPESPGRSESNRQTQTTQTNQAQNTETSTQVGRGGLLRIDPSGNKLNVIREEKQETDTFDEIVINPIEDKNDIIIRSSNSASLVIRNKIFAQTHFPLMVNLETNELIVTTPKGTKTVTILPDKAVENMLAANVLDQLGGKGGILWLSNQATPSAAPTSTPSASPTPNEEVTPSGILTPSITEIATSTPTPEVSPEPELTEQIVLTQIEDGTIVYKIPGIKFAKFLRLFDVELKRTAVVSAETGELLSIEQDFLSQIISLLSSK